MSHEACRAGYQKLTTYIVKLQRELKAYQSKDLSPLKITIEEQEEALSKKDKEIENLKSQLTQAEYQIWKASSISSQDSNFSDVSYSSSRPTQAEGKSSKPQKTFLETDGSGAIPSLPRDIEGFSPVAATSKSSNSSMKNVSDSKKDNVSSKSETRQSTEHSSTSLTKDLVYRLISQNIQLKRIIQDLLTVRGTSISEYLKKCEYEDTIEQLSVQLQQSKSEIKRLNELLTMKGDKEGLQKKCTELITKNNELQGAVSMQQAIAEAYNRQHDKIKKQLVEARNQIKELEKQRLGTTVIKTEATALTPSSEKISQPIKPSLSSSVQPSPIASHASTIQPSPAVSRTTNFQPSVVVSRAPTSCAVEYQRAAGTNVLTRSPWGDLGIDGPQPEESHIISASLGDQGTTSASEVESKSNEELYTCDRCDAEFKDRGKYEDHRKRCQD